VILRAFVRFPNTKGIRASAGNTLSVDNNTGELQQMHKGRDSGDKIRLLPYPCDTQLINQSAHRIKVSNSNTLAGATRHVWSHTNLSYYTKLL